MYTISRAFKWAFTSRSRPAEHADEDDPTELEPSIRGEVAASEVSTELASSGTEMEEIDRAIIQAKADLAKAEEKERFLGLRIYKYQNELHERRLVLEEQLPSLHLAEEELDELLDEENPDDGLHEQDETILAADRARLSEKWELDNRALEKVVASHRTILMHCETIRRQLRALESKRQHLDDMRSKGGKMIGESGLEGRDAAVDHAGTEHEHAELGLMVDDRSPDLT